MKSGLLLLALLLGPVAAEPHQGNPERGLPIYAAYCASCHGFEGRGDGPMAPRLRQEGFPPANLSASSLQDRLSDSALEACIRKGHNTSFMPSWDGTLSDGQLHDLVAFVRELRLNGPPAPSPFFAIAETFEQGRILYGFRCLACHGEGGHGDGPLILAASGRVPDLAGGVLRGYSDSELRQIATGGLGHPRYEKSMWSSPLAPGELDALVFFLRGLGFQLAP